MGSFLAGLFGGKNDALNGDINNSGNIMGFGTGVGESAVNQGLGFDEALLSGNQAEEAKLLAPEISGIQKRGQQQVETAGEFGNRSGGTNASAQNNIDSQRSNVNDMVSQLTKGAASDVTKTGENLLNTGLSADELQAKQSQQRMENNDNSILGGAITGGVDVGMEALGI